MRAPIRKLAIIWAEVLGRREIAYFSACIAAAILLPAGVACAAAISQGYVTASSQAFEIGSLAELTEPGGSRVMPADSEHTQQLIGVVVALGDATLSLSRSEDVVQVATVGQVSVIVTDLAGDIEKGDPITASPIAGVGMKAVDGGKIVGLARSGFSASKAAKTVVIKTKNGTAHKVAVGSIPMDLQVSNYAAAKSKTIIPNFLQHLSNTIAGKDVTFGRIIISIIVLLAAIIVVVVLLFAGVRSSMLSIGRNPLAQSDIYRGLLQVLITGIGVLGLALGSVYIILTR